MNALAFPLRLAFGVYLLLNGVNHFFGPFYAEPAGTEPLAVQLMSALRHSHLFDVVMGFELATGVLILAGLAVPFALCVAMPISVCALYWALVLEHDPLWSALALAALAANAALMFAHLEAYRGVLARHALAAGERPEAVDNYDGLFMNPAARTPFAPFVAALLVLVAALAFYWFLVPSVTGSFAMATMSLPAVLLFVGRLNGMLQRD